MSDGTIGAVSASIAVIVAALVGAWINLRRSKVEAERVERNGVIHEWREITDVLQAKVQGQEKEIESLRVQVTKLYGELAAVRAQITARETERIQQRGELNELTRTVTELDKPNPEKVAEAIMPKLTEAMEAAKDAKGEK